MARKGGGSDTWPAGSKRVLGERRARGRTPATDPGVGPGPLRDLSEPPPAPATRRAAFPSSLCSVEQDKRALTQRITLHPRALWGRGWDVDVRTCANMRITAPLGYTAIVRRPSRRVNAEHSVAVAEVISRGYRLIKKKCYAVSWVSGGSRYGLAAECVTLVVFAALETPPQSRRGR